MGARSLLYSLGVDSVDSLEGGCTTHFLSLLLGELDLGILADYPLIVRLNPAIPWKTRGNASVVLRVYSDRDPRGVLEDVYSLALEYAKGSAGSDPGVVVYVGEPWGDARLRTLYLRALNDVVPPEVASRWLEKSGALYAGGRGVVGAGAGLASMAPGDPYSFELMAYRRPGRPRCIRQSLAPKIESSTPPCTVNNFDPVEGISTASPKGPDPVLAGFRGYCLEPLRSYRELLCEAPSHWVVYKTNQHVDAHSRPLTGGLTTYSTGTLEAVVDGGPLKTPGGHVIVKARSRLGSLDLAFYRETGPLREAASRLAPGDRVRVLGSIKPYRYRGRPTMAVEKLWVLGLGEGQAIRVNPRCPLCGRRLESTGRYRELRCPKCGYASSKGKLEIRATRDLLPGVYTPRPGRLKHLTSPHTSVRLPRQGGLAKPGMRLSSVYCRGPEPPPC